MMLTLTLAVGLLAAPAPRAELLEGWVVEVQGLTMYQRAETPKDWIIEVRGFIKHSQAKPKDRFIIEFQWPQAKPQPEPIEVQAIEEIYVDDLRAFIEQLKKH